MHRTFKTSRGESGDAAFPEKTVERSFRVTWPQQIEANVIKTAIVRLDRIFRRRNTKVRIVMMIHDALWVECHESEAEQVRYLMERMITTVAKLDVPLAVGFE
jgi:DNA polymerase-1